MEKNTSECYKVTDYAEFEYYISNKLIDTLTCRWAKKEEEEENSHHEAMKKANAHALEQPGLRFLPTKQLFATMTII